MRGSYNISSFLKKKSKFISGCPFPAPRQKACHTEISKTINIWASRLWDDRAIAPDVFKQFCFVRRNFRSSPEALDNLFFYILFFFWHRINILVYLPTFIFLFNKQKNPTSGEISQISQIAFLKQMLYPRDFSNFTWPRNETYWMIDI